MNFKKFALCVISIVITVTLFNTEAAYAEEAFNTEEAVSNEACTEQMEVPAIEAAAVSDTYQTQDAAPEASKSVS